MTWIKLHNDYINLEQITMFILKEVRNSTLNKKKEWHKYYYKFYTGGSSEGYTTELFKNKEEAVLWFNKEILPFLGLQNKYQLSFPTEFNENDIHDFVQDFSSDNGADIKEVSLKELRQIIHTHKPLGLFYAVENNNEYTAVDNSGGEAWTEWFDSLNKCLIWLEAFDD